MSSKKDQTAKVVEQQGGGGGGGGGNSLSAAAITTTASKTTTTTSKDSGDNGGGIAPKTTTYVFPASVELLASSSAERTGKQGSAELISVGASSTHGTADSTRLTTATTVRQSQHHRKMEEPTGGGGFTSATIGAAFTTRVQAQEVAQQSVAPKVTLKGIPGPPGVIRGKPPLLKTASLGPGISAFGSEEERQKTQAKSGGGVLQSVGRHAPLPACSLSNINKVGSQQQVDSGSQSRVPPQQHHLHHHHHHQHHGVPHHQPLSASASCGAGSVVAAQGNNSSGGVGVFPSLPTTMKMPQKSALKSGHYRSASHGGVIAPSRTIDVGSAATGGDATSAGIGKPSAMKRGHTRAASHGQIVEDPNQSTLKNHSRAPSKTDFILPPGHLEKEKERERSGSNAMIRGGALGPGSVISGDGAPGDPRSHQLNHHFPGKGHSRQASRTESIYTLRQHPTSARSKLFFWKKPKTENSRIRTIVPNHVVPSNTKSDQHPNGKYCNNRICTTKYTAISFLPKNLFEQFHRFANLYFISIVLLNWIPEISAFGKEIAMLPVMFVLGVTAIKDLFEDRRRYNSDKRINNATCRVWDREKERYIRKRWKEMRVGDIVHLSCNEAIPADILLLRTSDPAGLCYIETMNLDGESNLKQREVVRGFERKQDTFSPSKFDGTIEVEIPTTKVYHFSGKLIHKSDQKQVPLTKENLLLRDCYLKNTDFVEGVVVYAGQDTKAMLNNGGPRHKRTGLERLMNIEVVWCVVILAVLCIIGATGSTLWSSSYEDVPFLPTMPGDESKLHPIVKAFFSFLTFIILLQVMIPLSLYVTIELTKLLQIYHIHNDVDLYDPDTNKRVQCRAMNITEDLGQIQYIFSDKTGTLTENKMMFRRCCIGGIDFDHTPPTQAEELRFKKSSSCPPLKPNPSLGERLSQASARLSLEAEDIPEEHRRDIQRVYDFFMILASCNTVVVAKHPHHDNMNASGVIEGSGTGGGGAGSEHELGHYARLSPIRESADQSLTSSIYSTTQDHSTLLVEYHQNEPDIGSENSTVGTHKSAEDVAHPEPTIVKPAGGSVVINAPSSGGGMKRPRLLDFRGARPLSPISSSNETTPTESPAQRPRFLQIPPIPILSRFNKTFQVNSPSQPQTVTPSPSEFKPIYEAESPDELALVQAAYAYQCRLVKRTPQAIKIAMPDEGAVEYDVLQTFPFDSVRKRMSIVLRHASTKEIVMYCKGADGAIFPRLKADRSNAELVSRTQTFINNYAREGLRVLVMAKRRLTEAEYATWLVKFQQAELDMENRDNLMYDAWCSLESNMELVGATGVEDRLQDRVPETIEALRNAGIVVWVLTGDKQETAVNIAYSCRLFTATMDIIKLNARSKDAADKSISFYLDQMDKIKYFQNDSRGGGGNSMDENVASQDPLELQRNNCNSDNNQSTAQHRESDALFELSTNERALVVDGRTLTYILDVKAGLITKFLRLTKHCQAVLCCRATPLQKACIVSSVKDQLGMITLAIGDGANDVSMIQRADIGIGISGKEGMQAVMASDFAISKFKFLEKLLLVHGHWCYDRLARMILYFFYKNAAFVFVIFWYQLLNGWSGSVMIDQMYLMVFNLFFTALPPMAIGVYDQDASAELLLSTPKLYKQGRLQLIHQPHTFWLNMLDALYQSIVIFFVAYGAYNGSDVGMFEFGTTITVSCMFSMLSHMAIEAKSWTMIHVLSILVSVLGFYGFAFVYNTFCINCLGFENPFWVIHEIITSPVHWLTVLISTVLAVIPRMSVRCFLTSVYPSDVTKALLIRAGRHGRPSNNEEELFGSWSRSSSSSSVFNSKISFFCCRKMDHGRPVQSSSAEIETGDTSTAPPSIPAVAT